MTVDRRTALTLFGVGAALSAPGVAAAAADVAVRFEHGVASGDPTAGGAILWTRATPTVGDAAADVPIRWFVAEREDAPPVAQGRTTARAARDFTVKVEPKGLAPGRDHVFWFTAKDGTKSPVGRFRTLPVGAAADAVLAVVSCQLFTGGLFNAYDAIARLPRVDAVVHLGDYIYEYGQDGYGAETGRTLNRMLDPAHEIVTLDDYRRRHACYKRDPDLQAAHARRRSSAYGTIMKPPMTAGSAERRIMTPAKATGGSARPRRCRPISNGCRSAIRCPAGRTKRSTAVSSSER